LHFSLPAKLDNFAVGMLLAVLVATIDGRWRIPTLGAWILRFGGLAVIAWTFAERPYSSVPVPSTFADTWFHAISAAAFTAIIASTVLGPRHSPWTRVLARPSLQLMGILSYSIYMWHEPIMIEFGKRENLIHTAPDAFLTNVFWLVLLTVGVAYFSFRAIERPTMELRHIFGPTGRFVQRYLPLPPPKRSENERTRERDDSATGMLGPGVSL
jgi:peptidoglycan/LPS O-acetylase OafA/YrhL